MKSIESDPIGLESIMKSIESDPIGLESDPIGLVKSIESDPIGLALVPYQKLRSILRKGELFQHIFLKKEMIGICFILITGMHIHRKERIIIVKGHIFTMSLAYGETLKKMCSGLCWMTGNLELPAFI